jgi:DNA-binding MarR family transcriptional regulator
MASRKRTPGGARGAPPPATAAIDDPVLLLTAAAAQANHAIIEQLRADGFGDTRYADGFVIQHLVPGPRPVGDLAPLLAVTQQAASKLIVDLERRGYVQRRPSETDGRVKLVELTDRGVAVVQAARRARAKVVRRIERSLGPDHEAFVTHLRTATDALGGVDALLDRKLRL